MNAKEALAGLCALALFYGLMAIIQLLEQL